MAAKQLPIDIKVLRVFAYRYKWLLVILTFSSFAFSAFIVKSMVSLYSAATTIYVDPENVLGEVARGVAVSTSLNDQLETLRHLILNEDFIEPHVIQELDIRWEDVYTPPFNLQFMPSAIELGERLKNFIKALFKLPVYSLTEEQKQLMERQEITNIVKENTSLRQSRGRFLQISYTGPNATACQRIVEIIANQCKELLLRNKHQETREAARYIERQYSDATRKLEEFERELSNLRVEQFDKGPEAKIALLQQRQTSLDTLRIVQQDLENQNASKQRLEIDKANRQTVLRQDPEITAQLLARSQDRQALEMEALKTRLAQLEERGFTDEWPELISLKQQIASKKDSLNDKIQSDPEAEEKIFLADPIYNEYYRQIRQVETELQSLHNQEKKLLSNIALYEDKLRGMPEIEKSFEAIQRKIDLQTELQTDLAKRRETARATQELEKSRGENRIRIVNRDYPDEPIGLSPIVIMLAISLLGPISGSAIVFLVYYLNTSVKSAEDVQIEYNFPVIAIIPKTNFRKELKKHKKVLNVRRKKRASRLKNRPETSEKSLLETSPDPAIEVMHTDEVIAQHDDPAEIELFDTTVERIPTPLEPNSHLSMVLTMLTNPTSYAAEEYRRLCFNVEWGLKEALSGPCKSIMVTSALPNEGKTVTALNLASTLARNHRVLLVDANFRKAAVHEVFEIPQKPGLSDMLEQAIRPKLYFPPDSPNLSILPAGGSATHPADALSSKQMYRFIDSIKGSSYFEYAIFDVPPVSLIPDSSIIASQLDGIVWIIWELNTAKEVVRLALSRITNPSILGVVLNRSEQQVLPRKYGKLWKEYQQHSSRIQA
ncbi:hypothetical protein CSB45_04350 [candidate division KSB3 bacterium]|uniref:CobQ/CobB/MinD/ParA nucleotide binding domain-containing protein n=1 Tax=candidate division KSB3 bacterium TaxID=2044937 RepID=A0A2G6E888_9BACT|nr:MAG: hypothetical protein CSB45_04350 [candidate division KSB3 bacterium]PIE30608.1 MAG: hypothetical protein CSA57_02935 [candidate division KSB3 bacterium]